MQLQYNIPLEQYSNFRIGGPAKYFYAVQTIAELEEAIVKGRELGKPIFILGGGNNLLIHDQGFDGLVIRVVIGGMHLGDNNLVTAGAGVLVSEFLDFCIKNELSGWEWAGGLPGTMGGAIWGNAGAFGGETKDSVVHVTSLQVLGNTLHTRSREECAFGYRTSIFKEQQHSHFLKKVRMSGGQEIVTSMVLQMKKGDRAAIRAAIEEKKAYRVAKQPLEYPNVGSIFKNVPVEKVPPVVLTQFQEKIKQDPFPVLPTAVLVSAAGLKGYRIGGAQVSEKHANFIINLGAATAADVCAVMRHVQAVIAEKYGITLEQEVIFIGFDQ